MGLVHERVTIRAAFLNMIVVIVQPVYLVEGQCGSPNTSLACHFQRCKVERGCLPSHARWRLHRQQYGGMSGPPSGPQRAACGASVSLLSAPPQHRCSTAHGTLAAERVMRRTVTRQHSGDCAARSDHSTAGIAPLPPLLPKSSPPKPEISHMLPR